MATYERGSFQLIPGANTVDISQYNNVEYHRKQRGRFLKWTEQEEKIYEKISNDRPDFGSSNAFWIYGCV